MIGEAAAAPPGGLLGAQWRRWRAPAVLVAFILLGGVLVAALGSAGAVSGPLDPRGAGPTGARAIAALLRGRGQTVVRVSAAAAAAAAARAPGATLVVTDPDLLSSADRAAVAGSRANLVLIAPDQAALAALAPGVRLAGTAAVRGRAAGCALAAARMAGSAWMGGLLLRTGEPGAWLCYPAADGGASRGAPPSQPPSASLVRYVSGGRAVTVLGTGIPFTNRALGQDGNAALAMNLLGAGRRVVWLVPGPSSGGPGAASGGGAASALIPGPAVLVALEVVVAVLLAAIWRVRRFGPLIAEPLPVVVRASETVRGHGRLYRARRARGRAAGVLRAAALSRIAARLALPGDLTPAAMCQEVAARAGRDQDDVAAVLFGPAPADDAGLIALAAALDTLEGQVLSP